MKTITIQIGNSDNKLTQQQWNLFVAAINNVISLWTKEVYFAGGPPSDAQWQNYCWVIDGDMSQHDEDIFKSLLAKRRAAFQQESLSYVVGMNSFI